MISLGLIGYIVLSLNFSFAETKNFSAATCREYKHAEIFNSSFSPEKANINQRWILAEIDKTKKLVSAEYRCQNGSTRKLSYNMSPESTETGTAIAEIRCSKSFLIERSIYPMGEGHRNNYVDLKTCEELGFGDIERFSANGQFGILAKEADVEAGYTSDTGSIYILICEKGSCVRKGKELFKEMGFTDLKWQDPNTIIFKTLNLRSTFDHSVKPNKQLCSIRFKDNSYKIECKEDSVK